VSDLHPILNISGKHVVMDLIESWPSSVLNILDNNRKLIKRYLDEETRVELLSRENVEIRCFPPCNPYKQQYLEVDQKITEILMAHSFIGFHATRLTQQEISNIMLDGLQPLTPKLVEQKTNILRRDNHISTHQAELIIQNNSSHKKYRQNMVWVFHCVSSLTDSGGLDNLFGYWGGEAIHRHFKEDKGSSLDLKQIGQPCIVVCLLPGNEMDTFPTMSERMIKYWNSLQNSKPITCDFDHCVEHKVEVIKVISEEDDLFYQLTNYLS